MSEFAQPDGAAAEPLALEGVGAGAGLEGGGGGGDAAAAAAAPETPDVVALASAAGELTLAGGGGVTRTTDHLISSTSFTDPSLGISRAVQDALTIDENKAYASMIQSVSIPAMNAGMNVKAHAPSGSGKTIAFAIGMINKIDPTIKKVQAICVAPYLELALQIADQVTSLCRRTGQAEYGGVAQEIKVQTLLRGWEPKDLECDCQIVVGTPGMILKFSDPRGWKTERTKEKRKAYFRLETARVFVVDEADAQVQAKDNKDNKAALLDLIRMLPQTCQICMFSATFPEETNVLVEKALQRGTETTKFVEVGIDNKEELKLEEIKQISIDVSKLKKEFLEEFYAENPGLIGDAEFRAQPPPEHELLKIAVLRKLLTVKMEKCIIFVTTRQQATHIQKMCNKLDPPIHPECLYGGSKGDPFYMSPEERTEVANRFKQGKFNVLIATSLIARGFDVPECSAVVNFELPIVWETKEGDHATYVHRVGRTGRFGTRGFAVNLLHGGRDEELLSNILRQAYMVEAAAGSGGAVSAGIKTVEQLADRFDVANEAIDPILLDQIRAHIGQQH